MPHRFAFYAAPPAIALASNRYAFIFVRRITDGKTADATAIDERAVRVCRLARRRYGPPLVRGVTDDRSR
jgi:hypothetical protein